jgi:Ca-activated chloride channel homolog
MQSMSPKIERIKMKRKTIYACLLVTLSAFTTALLWGWQEPAQPDQAADEQKPFTIGVEVNMVSVPVSVRRQEGGFYKGLSKKSFQIFEDGKLQEIVFFAEEGLPTHIAIVLDVSGSVRTEWGTIKSTTARFLENLRPDDAFSLITFASDIRLKMDWGNKTDRLDTVLTSVYCKGNTKLWDALWVVSNDVFKGVTGKKAIIIMSDGMDNESEVTFEEALKAAVRSEAAIYVVSKTEAVLRALETNYDNVPQEQFVAADQVLRKLAYETGGRVLYPNSFGELGEIYAQVDEELRNQYSVGYISTNTAKDGTYRKIGIRVNAPGASLSVRPGYYAPDELSSRPGSRR